MKDCTYGRTDGIPLREDRRYKHPDGVGEPGTSAKTKKGRDLRVKMGLSVGSPETK